LEEIQNILNHTTSVEQELCDISTHHKGKIVFSTSFGIEDQVITHLIASNKIDNIEIFTLDTGRLFPETYQVWDKTLLKYHVKIKSYYPNNGSIEKYTNDNGINAFYNSIDLRKECCNIRKVEPLKRALDGATLWITGLRAEQSNNRNGIEKIQYDSQYNLIKYNPLLDWSYDDVNTYISKNKVPYNSLHTQGFVSIGCAPCTRAIKDGEDFRAGRWWWEDENKKECGLHSN